MTNLTIATPDVTADRAECAAVVVKARALVVATEADAHEAGDFLRRCAGAAKAVESKLAPAVEAAHKAHKSLTALRAELTEPFAAARKIVEPRLVAWQDAERRRREAEAARQAEEARRRIAEEQLAAAAEVAEYDPDAADAILDEPVIAPVVVPVAPVVAGVSVRETWKAEVVDLAELVRYVAEAPTADRLALVAAAQSALDGLARALKGAASIPGVRFVPTRSATVRT